MTTLAHPIGGIERFLVSLTADQRQRYMDAVDRRLSGALPMAFSPEAQPSHARRYFEETTTESLDGIVTVDVEQGGQTVATLAVATASEQAKQAESTPSAHKPTPATGVGF